MFATGVGGAIFGAGFIAFIIIIIIALIIVVN